MVDSIVRKARRNDGSLSFVVTEIGSRTGWNSDEVRTENSQGVRDLLQRCLHSDLDVLLPKISSTGAAELYFIVAVTDQIGAEAIIARIQRRMGRSEYVQQAGLIVSTSCQLLDAPDTDAADLPDVSVAKMSGKIQELIDFALTSRKMAHAN
jgi:hypothetical protein